MTEKYTPAVVYKRLVHYSFQYWQIFALGIAGMVGFALADTSMAWLVKPLMDEGFVNRDPTYIKYLPIALLGIFVLRGISGFTSSYCMAWVGRGVIRDLRREIFDKLLTLPVGYYDQSTSGKLISRLTYNVEQVANSVTSAVISVVKDGLTMIGLIGLMFYLSAKMAMLVFIGGPIIAGTMLYVSKRFRSYSRRIQNSMGDVTHLGEEVIGGQRVVKVFGGQAFERGNFSVANEKNRILHNRLSRAGAVSTPIVQFIAALAIAAVIYMATHATGEQALTPGTFISFFGAMVGLMGPIRRLSIVNATIQRGIAAATDIFELLEEPGEDQGGDKCTERAQGNIAIERMSFRYPHGDKLVLEDIDLDIKSGNMVAFVGKSGSGKSTLLSLIPRFYDPSGGRILLDGHDIREYSLPNLREQIALVDQNVVLFNDTVARNIAYGTLDNTKEEDIIAAAEQAYAMEFIKKLPQGLDTQVGQHGVLLSGGQRQRLAIARALLKNAPILILDEATSALDTESERMIQQALDHLIKNRTTLVIAHRLSTVQGADKIVVMDDGRIVEQGTHQELLDKGGHYSALYKVQIEGNTAA
ncbi:MAG: lipid A export permease/ATP-binding protein MsbA [Nevskiales bacterium]